MKAVELLMDAKATLGEGPAWDEKTQTLYWVDILEKKLHLFNGIDRILQLEDYVGCVAPCKDGQLILALRNGFWKLDPGSKDIKEIAVPAGEPAGNRFNDGKCDPAGRFLAGTMDMAERLSNGSLYSLSPDGQLKKLLRDLRISNGMTWSPKHDILYFIDTPTREVKAFDYDGKTGDIGNPRVVVRIPEELGWPDGMTSDTDGHLWIGMWGGAQVTRWDAGEGKLLTQVKIPALNITSCVFGGKEMNELYVTSACNGMSESEIAAYPHSGGLFRLKTDVRGMPTFEFGN